MALTKAGETRRRLAGRERGDHTQTAIKYSYCRPATSHSCIFKAARALRGCQPAGMAEAVAPRTRRGAEATYRPPAARPAEPGALSLTPQPPLRSAIVVVVTGINTSTAPNKSAGAQGFRGASATFPPRLSLLELQAQGGCFGEGRRLPCAEPAHPCAPHRPGNDRGCAPRRHLPHSVGSEGQMMSRNLRGGGDRFKKQGGQEGDRKAACWGPERASPAGPQAGGTPESSKGVPQNRQ